MNNNSFLIETLVNWVKDNNENIQNKLNQGVAEIQDEKTSDMDAKAIVGLILGENLLGDTYDNLSSLLTTNQNTAEMVDVLNRCKNESEITSILNDSMDKYGIQNILKTLNSDKVFEMLEQDKKAQKENRAYNQYVPPENSIEETFVKEPELKKEPISNQYTNYGFNENQYRQETNTYEKQNDESYTHMENKNINKEIPAYAVSGIEDSNININKERLSSYEHQNFNNPIDNNRVETRNDLNRENEFDNYNKNTQKNSNQYANGNFEHNQFNNQFNNQLDTNQNIPSYSQDNRSLVDKCGNSLNKVILGERVVISPQQGNMYEMHMVTRFSTMNGTCEQVVNKQTITREEFEDFAQKYEKEIFELENQREMGMSERQMNNNRDYEFGN